MILKMQTSYSPEEFVILRMVHTQGNVHQFYLSLKTDAGTWIMMSLRTY